MTNWCVLPWLRFISSAFSTPWLSVVLCGGLRPSGHFPSHVNMSFGVPCSACFYAAMLVRLHGFFDKSKRRNLKADFLFIWLLTVLLPLPSWICWCVSWAWALELYFYQLWFAIRISICFSKWSFLEGWELYSSMGLRTHIYNVVRDHAGLVRW